jgi:hypothetical protein
MRRLLAQVTDCKNWREVFTMSQKVFFNQYDQDVADDDSAPMLKLKDWPPNAHFRERLGRHNQVMPCPPRPVSVCRSRPPSQI